MRFCFLRLRVERKLRKRLRGMQHEKWQREMARAVQRYERQGLPLRRALLTIVTDRVAGWIARADAARVLAISDGGVVAQHLLEQFFSQEGSIALWQTALTLETLGDLCAVRPLIVALSDANVDRRAAAARALGWIRGAGQRAANALSAALADLSQPVAVREEAAESLAYLHSPRAIPGLIKALSDPDVRIRFWSVFALGSICNRRTYRNTYRSVVPALEAMLTDHAVPPGNWWSVSREALAMLGQLDHPEARYRQQLTEETRRVLNDPASSPEDRRWAENYIR